MSALNVDFTHTLDNIDQLSSLRGKLANLTGPLTNYPTLTARFGTLVSKLGGQTVEQLREQIEQSFDSSVNDAFLAISASQRVRLESVRALIAADDEKAPEVTGEFDRYYKQRNLPDNETPDLLYMLLMRPTNQSVYAQLDKYAALILQKTAAHLNVFTNRLERVTAQTTTEVLAEIKFELEAVIDRAPEEELRAWLEKTSVCCGGRMHKRIMSLLATAEKQAELVRPNEWYPNWFNMLAKLPEASRLFGKHETEVTTALNIVESRLVDLAHLKTEKTPAYLAQLVAEFGHQVSEAMNSVHALLSIRSLFIQKFNDVKENVTPN